MRRNLVKERAKIADRIFELHAAVNILISKSVERIMDGADPILVVDELVFNLANEARDMAQEVRQ